MSMNGRLISELQLFLLFRLRKRVGLQTDFFPLDVAGSKLRSTLDKTELADIISVHSVKLKHLLIQ